MFHQPDKMYEHKHRILPDNFTFLYQDRVQRLIEGGVDFAPNKREGYRYWNVDGREILDLHPIGGEGVG